MNNFSPRLKIAFAHRVNVVGCVLTSLVVAVLWGGNLTAVFPVVDVIMNDQSLPQWIDQKIAESDREVAEIDRWLAQLEQLKSSDAETDPAADRSRDRRIAAPNWPSTPRSAPDHLERRADRRKNAARQLHRAAGNAAERCRPTDCAVQVIEQEIRDDRASHRRLQPSGPTVSLDRPGRPSLDARPRRSARCWSCACSCSSARSSRACSASGTAIVVARLGHIVGYDLRMEFYRQMLRLDMANFTEAGRGDLMNRCTSDLNSISQGVQRLFGQALLEPLKMVVCFGIAAWVSWRLLLLTIIIAPLAGYSIHWLGKALKRTHRQAMQELSSIYETLTETLGGIKLIKAFTMEPAEQQRFHQSAKEYLPPADADRHVQLAGQPHRSKRSASGWCCWPR